jgi:hypothetical protein
MPQNHLALDGVRFEDQPARVQETFRANYADQAADEWVAEHNADLTSSAPVTTPIAAPSSTLVPADTPSDAATTSALVTR